MKKILKLLINILLVSIFFYSVYNIYIKLNDYKKADNTYTNLRELKEDKIKDLSNINEDFRFWIKVDATNIDYPVVQSEDNDFYLYKDFYKKKLGSGTIFLDYRNDYDSDKNLIVYGHNMKNKSMFNNLELFKNEEFFSKNNKIRICDKSGEHIYEVFAVMVVDATFDYIVPKFDNNEDFNFYLDSIKSEAMYFNDVSEIDNIITLSTCSYEFKDARTVVFGKKID